MRREIPPKKPTKAPVNPVMISVASMRNPNQAVVVQKIVAATIAAKICGRNAVVFIISSSPAVPAIISPLPGWQYANFAHLSESVGEAEVVCVNRFLLVC
jgi:hypothetical protein